MQRYWTGFAKKGYPSPSWLTFNRTGLVQSLVPPGPKPETDFATAHYCAFWRSLLG
jgi:para-nitrobenzyl esterase